MAKTLHSAICAGVLAMLAIAAAAQASQPVRVIRVTARKYKFLPDPIEVRQGEKIVLEVTAIDHDHGFKIAKLHINKLLKKGRTVRIVLPTNRPGEYTIHCSHFCGIGHFWMKGKLIIYPRMSPPPTPPRR